MISPEERNKKPYALPVQCLAYDSLPDETVRSISNALIQEMSTRGMKVAGELTLHHLLNMLNCYSEGIHCYFLRLCDHWRVEHPEVERE